MHTVNFRLKAILGLILFAFILLALLSGRGIQSASASLENLYTQGLQHTIRSGRILEHLGNARSYLLLAYQHDPSNEFSDMHNHSTNKHLVDIEKELEALHRIIDREILTSQLVGDELRTAEALARHFDAVTQEGFLPAIRAIRDGDFRQSNLTLLKVINPAFKQINEEANAFLELQIDEARHSVAQAHNNESQFYWLFGSVTLVCVGIIAGVFVLVSSRINRAASQLHSVAGEVSQGNLTARLIETGQDEFSAIAKNVNAIVENFSHVIGVNRDSVGQLAVAAEESATVTSQTKQNILAQQQQTQLIATAIQELNATVHEVAKSAGLAAEASSNADGSAREGLSIVENSMSMIEKLALDMEESVSAMRSLAQHVGEISNVVEVIQGISEQTNLLALNAAIEAARAGEQGRGFAVVADEVRTLASRTQDSTLEIQTTIQSLQQHSNESSLLLEKGAENAMHTSDNFKNAGHALTQIVKNVTDITDMNTQIATAAEQQSVVTEDINKNIITISDISNQTACGAEQSASAIEELAKLGETIKSEIDEYQIQPNRTSHSTPDAGLVPLAQV